MDDLKEKLRKIYIICQDIQDKQLNYFYSCFLKMERVYVKAMDTEMHSYVFKIIHPAFPLAVDYFINRLEAYRSLVNLPLSDEKQTKRMNIYKDIEESVIALGEAIEFVIQSINPADRMLVQTPPLDSGLLHSAPKISAYFSEMLNELATIINNNANYSYGFCVYPSMYYRSRTKVLFQTKEQAGKVALIQIPNVELFHLSYLRIILIHELYHVIFVQKAERRKARAKAFLKILLYDLGKKLTHSISGPDNNLSKEQRRIIERILFEPIINEIQNELKNRNEEDLIYRSMEIEKYMVEKFTNRCIELTSITKKTIYQELFQNQILPINYEDYESKMNLAENIRLSLRKATLRILAKNRINEICSFYIRIFREVFSDLSTIWTLRPNPVFWIETFRYTANNKNDKILLPTQYTRISLVIYILSHIGDTDEIPCSVWSKYQDYLKVWADFKNKILSSKSKNEFENGLKNYILIMENKESDLRGDTSPNEFKQILQVRKIYDHYLKYFFSCMRAILEFENRNIAKFENFRTKFFIDINQSFEYSSSALKNNLYAENDFETLLYIADRRWEIGD